MVGDFFNYNNKSNSKIKYIPLLLIILCYVIFMSSFSDFVPLWDALINTSWWITQAVTAPFNPFNFDQAGHPSMVYTFLISIGQYFDLGNISLIHISNIILSVASICAFYGILQKIFTDNKFCLELYLVTFLYAFFPIFTGNILHINPDNGLLIFDMLFLYFLLNRQKLFSILSAIGLIFSKDTGIAIYLITLICYVCLNNNFKNKVTKASIVKIFKNAAYLLIPAVIFILRFAVISLILKQPAIYWEASSLIDTAKMSVLWPSWNIHRIPLSYALIIFVINFNWILSIFVLLGILNFIFLLITKKFHQNKSVSFTILGFMMYLFLGTTFIQTFIKTFTNPRYFLPVYPILILLFYFGLISVINQVTVRRIILTVIVILFFLTNFRTFDPISKRIYGTFKFGNHEMLNLTSITGECCGYGRDQLVYNMQYTNFHYLLNTIFEDIKPDKDTAIAYNRLMGPMVLARLDNETYHRTIKTTGSFIPYNVSWTFAKESDSPQVIYFIEFLNIDNREALSFWGQYYDVKQRKKYDRSGYSLTVDKLEQKN